MANTFWIIGGANIDIIGCAAHPLKDYDSNIGTISTSFGGVGRNIAQACAELGEKVNLVTCFGADGYADVLKESCKALGIDTTFSIDSNKYGTSVYLALLDEHRDMRIAMNDMSILSELDRTALIPALEKMDDNDFLIIDSNLDSRLIEFIVENTSAKIASDPVSAAKAPRLKPVLNKIDIFKPNAVEAQELTGIDIFTHVDAGEEESTGTVEVDESRARESLEWFLSRGVKEIIITLGSKGVLLGTPSEKLWITHKTVEMESANGGGDAMFGAYLSRRMRGDEPRKAIEFAITMAIHKITNQDNLETLDIKEKRL